MLDFALILELGLEIEQLLVKVRSIAIQLLAQTGEIWTIRYLQQSKATIVQLLIIRS